MKKRSVLSLFVLLVPFLMANSPSPERYPINYNDYELVNESASISQEGTTKYITFYGELQNTGAGIISFRHSNLTYRFEGDYYTIFDYNYNENSPVQGLLPGKSYSFADKFSYPGSAPVGDITYSTTSASFLAYVEEDIVTTIVVSNLLASSGEYQSSYDMTIYTISFDWENTGEVSAETIFISFAMGEEEYVYYEWENIGKEESGHADINIAFDGDITASEPEIENIQLFFIRRAYESYGWNFFGSAFFQTLIVASIVVGALIVLAPVAAITTIVIISVVKNKRKNQA